jgi:hypothetical protein
MLSHIRVALYPLSMLPLFFARIIHLANNGLLLLRLIDGFSNILEV